MALRVGRLGKTTVEAGPSLVILHRRRSSQPAAGQPAPAEAERADHVLFHRADRHAERCGVLAVALPVQVVQKEGALRAIRQGW